MAASFLAMNEVYGANFNVSQTELFEPAAREENGPPRDLFRVRRPDAHRSIEQEHPQG